MFVSNHIDIATCVEETLEYIKRLLLKKEFSLF